MSVTIHDISNALREYYGLSEANYAKLRLIRRYWDKASWRLRGEARRLEHLARTTGDPDAPINELAKYMRKPNPWWKPRWL